MNDTNGTPELARRGFLGHVARTAAAVSGALFLHPASVAVASPVRPAEATPMTMVGQTVPVPTVHPAECFHAKYASGVDRAEFMRLSREFQRELTREQWTKHDRLVNMEGDLSMDAEDQFVDELCRHFPGLAPAIRYVAYHLGEQRLTDIGVCCEGDLPA